ncbi:hypothetical protein [Microbacterium sp. NPDC055683]
MNNDPHDAFLQAVIVLATMVNVDARIAADPGYVADRTGRATALRAQHLAEALHAFRVARARFEEARSDD